MYDRDNVLKAIRFETPKYIPMKFVINDSCWNAYPQKELFDLMEEHPFLFPDFERKEIPYVPDYSNVAQKITPIWMIGDVYGRQQTMVLLVP
ncbi:hypothetical protein LC724_11910 [Blautia sp. RD014234]|nr:hypothetical protein [Blautia parvula]